MRINGKIVGGLRINGKTVGGTRIDGDVTDRFGPVLPTEKLWVLNGPGDNSFYEITNTETGAATKRGTVSFSTNSLYNMTELDGNLWVANTFNRQTGLVKFTDPLTGAWTVGRLLADVLNAMTAHGGNLWIIDSRGVLYELTNFDGPTGSATESRRGSTRVTGVDAMTDHNGNLHIIANRSLREITSTSRGTNTLRVTMPSNFGDARGMTSWNGKIWMIDTNRYIWSADPSDGTSTRHGRMASNVTRIVGLAAL